MARRGHQPGHGHEVVVYTQCADRWIRHVIDDSFQNGHALAAGDLDGDGRADIVCIDASTHNFKWYESTGP
jgi:hypothetical protein